MKKLSIISLTIFCLAIFSCTPAEDKRALHQALVPDTLQERVNMKEYNKNLLVPKETEMDGYIFKTFYTDYDQYKYGLSNPACLEVYKNDELLFKEDLKAYDEISVVSKGYHDLGGRKLIFTLDYGTEASDYLQASRYYAISDNRKVTFIRQLWSSSAEDKNRYFEHIFPEDSSGYPDRLVIVEGLVFKAEDLPNRYDTTHVDFNKSGFVIKQLSNHIEKK